MSSTSKLLLRTFFWVILLHGLTVFQDIALLGGAEKEPNVKVGDFTLQQHSQKSNKCWVFTHLQKSGGSSIKTIVRKGCESCTEYVYDIFNWCREIAAPDPWIAQGQDKYVIMGGYTEALRLHPNFNDCSWFTVFRHPIPRLVSAFFYCKTGADTCCGARNMPSEVHHNITSFAKYWGNYAVRQFALGLVPAEDVLNYFQANKGPDYGCVQDSGWYWLKLYLEEKSTYPASISHEEGALYDMLQQIKDVVTEKFTAVGILEEFNTTISLFNTALQIPGLDWRKKFSKIGVVKADRKYEDEEKEILADSWTNAELKSYINLDILLYQHAVDVFHQQAQFHGVY